MFAGQISAVCLMLKQINGCTCIVIPIFPDYFTLRLDSTLLYCLWFLRQRPHLLLQKVIIVSTARFSLEL